jgi:hypothetical protein
MALMAMKFDDLHYERQSDRQLVKMGMMTTCEAISVIERTQKAWNADIITATAFGTITGSPTFTASQGFLCRRLCR